MNPLMVSNVGDCFLLKLKVIYFGTNLWSIDTRAKDNSCTGYCDSWGYRSCPHGFLRPFPQP